MRLGSKDGSAIQEPVGFESRLPLWCCCWPVLWRCSALKVRQGPRPSTCTCQVPEPTAERARHRPHPRDRVLRPHAGRLSRRHHLGLGNHRRQCGRQQPVGDHRPEPRREPSRAQRHGQGPGDHDRGHRSSDGEPVDADRRQCSGRRRHRPPGWRRHDHRLHHLGQYSHEFRAGVSATTLTST